MAALTGSRRGVLIEMEVCDFDPEHQTLEARPEIRKRGKGHLYHLPPIAVQCLMAITRNRQPNERLFVNDEGMPFTPKSFELPDNQEKPSPWRV